MIDLAEVFEKFEDDYLTFDKLENQLYPRPDICAWMMLDKLVPTKSRDMVCSAGHDGEQVQDAIGEVIAEALNQYFERMGS